jgi:ubiquinone/menaquinone biosynthesis C-methylase UbiE
MDRILEPELMNDPQQALIYAQADFEKENQGFVDRFREYFPEFTEGHILDLGCGPGDIPVHYGSRCVGTYDRTGGRDGEAGWPV